MSNHQVRALLAVSFLTLLVPVAGARGEQILLSKYDIDDAVLSGHGNWAHTYSGTITPGASFVNFVNGRLGTYRGGGGTLTDGVIGSTLQTSQLFVTPQATDGTVIRPVITFFLDAVFTLDTIDLYGGDIPNNGIPGELTGVTVTLVTPDLSVVSHAFQTTPFGTVQNTLGSLVNDRVVLGGSPLEGIAATRVILSDFIGTNSNWFSLTEVQMFGNRVSVTPIPEPTSLVLMGTGLLALIGARPVRRRWMGRSSRLTLSETFRNEPQGA
ncbi:PEP-CTERM sorting domain-containing protein [Tautonia rosea]|uniref:PEP-CTERM sorting domain-containing protein n=1 Tax=Tautonia rosea TaxID=2728037 RepID=UPI00147403BD|nr:PEP-CTERM sorting domain-containing protein [Tautonia rosea]